MTPSNDLQIDAGARVLVVMARPLVAGDVKTRLAADIGGDAALALYARLLTARSTRPSGSGTRP